MRKLLLLSLFLVMAIASRAQFHEYSTPDFTVVHDGVTYQCKIIDETNRKVCLLRFPQTDSYPAVQTLIL